MGKFSALAAMFACALLAACAPDSGAPKVCGVADASAQAELKARSANLGAALEFINRHGVEGLKKMSGKIPIAGDKVYANISDIALKPVSEEPVFEAHNKFIDLHLILEGGETIGFKRRGGCSNVVSDKLAESDYILFKEKPDAMLKLRAGEYVVLFPRDAHAPSLGEGKVRKCVVKIAVE